jgi:PAS domain S-box-containing protein
MLNKLLQRQVQKHFANPDAIPEEFSALLKVVSEAYDHYEKDRNMLERSIELSSDEMIDLNTRLRCEAAELEKKNRELNILFNNIAEVMFSVDMTNYRLIQISPSCEKVYGYKTSEFLSNDDLWQEVIHPEDRHISREQLDYLYKGQQVFNQYRIIHKDSSVRWIENKIIPTLDNSGKLVRLDGLTTDITEKRKNARKLQESEIRFRALIDNSADMLSLLDDQGVVVYNSPAFLRILGYKENEAKELRGFDLVHPDDRDKALEAFETIMKNPGVAVPLAMRMKKSDEEFIFVEGNITNLLSVPGVHAIVSNFRDVTTRIKAERSLAESQEKYRMVYENPFLGIAIGGIDGFVQNVNEAFSKMVGYSENELKGKHFSIFTLPEDMEKEMPYILQMANGEIENYQLEKRYLTKSKKNIWVDLSISCVKDETGKIQSLVAVVQDITARKKAEELLYQSEVNMASILENTDDHVYSLDKNHCYITFNNRLRDTMKRLYNLDIKPGQKTYGFLEQFDPAEAKFYEKTYNDAIETGKPVQFVKDYSTASYRSYASFSINPIRENNVVTGLSCFVRDITQQKISEELLHKSEANLRNLLENTDTAYVLLDTNATILSFNNLAREFAAKEMDEALEEGKNYVDIMLPERKESVRHIISEVLQKKESVRYEVKYGNEDLNATWLLVSMHPIMDKTNRLLGLSIAATNITARKNAEQELKGSNERYELAGKATNDAIWDWNLATGEIYWSESYEKLFGYKQSRDKLLDLYSGGTKIHPEDRERVSVSIEMALTEKRNYWENEYKYIKSNNELAYVSDRGYIMYDENKKPLRMVGAMRDITAEKLSAMERDKITVDLIRQNKDLEQFSYIVSHNLRAPLANIAGLSRIIQDEKLDAKARRLSVEGLTSSVKKLDDVISDLSHILQVKREINEKKELVKFSGLVDDITLSIRSILDHEKVTILTDFAQVDEIFSLKSYLHSIFYNLISNSIKYRNPLEKPVIEISSRESGDKIFLFFKDNGRGIDLDRFSDKVFGLYKRFHFNVEGKGMGLFMVKTQVETLDGKISITSNVNQGTLFTIEFKKQAIPFSVHQHHTVEKNIY